MATLKQKFAASKMVENGGNISMSMMQAGYAPSTAKTPQKLTQSKAWPGLMEKYFPDQFLLKKHRELLDKKEFVSVGGRGDRHIEPTGEIDPQAVARGLDMAYKLKNKYPAEKHQIDGNIAVVNIIKYGAEGNETIEAGVIK